MEVRAGEDKTRIERLWAEGYIRDKDKLAFLKGVSVPFSP